jgi:ABC-type oligopeptide transport system substrate-binding subunit
VRVKVLEDASRFKQKFVEQKCDALVIGLKSNSLDGYEFQLLFLEEKTNFMNFVDPGLQKLISDSQLIQDRALRYAEYRKISETIAMSCAIRPLVTITHRTVFVRENFAIEGLGFLALNDVLIDWTTR